MFSIENLLYLGANLFRVYVIYRFAKAFFKNKACGRATELTAYALFFITNSVAYLLISDLFINLATNVIPFLAITFLYKSRIYKKILVTVLIYAVNMLWEVVLFTMFSLLQIDAIVITTGIASILMLFLTELLFEHFSKFKGDSILSFSHLIAVVFIPVGSLVIGASTMTEPNVRNVINAFILIAVNVLIFFLYDALGRSYEKEHEKALLEQQSKAYINQLALVNESQKSLQFFKHDMENHFLQMKNLLAESDYSKLSTYLNDCSNYVKTEKRYLNSGNNDIDSILNYKLREIGKLGIEIKTKISLPTELHISVFDLNIVLGNLVDNAVEELKKHKKGKLAIEIKHKQGVLLIKIENTCFSELKIKDGRVLTSKGDTVNHGLGLQSVRHTLKKYDGEMVLRFDNNIVTVNALLYNNKSD